MRKTFFFTLFLMLWFIPSLAGCAVGGQSHVRPVASDAGSSVLSRDAGVPGFDAAQPAGVADASVSRDAGPPSPDAHVPDAGEHLLRIALAPSVRAECPAGWRIRLWLTDPPVESTRGLDLELHIPDLAYFGPWSSITLWCDERSPQWLAWDAVDRNALGSGAFGELSLDVTDLRASTMLCEDPLAPHGGFRPILMWDAGHRGSCPPL